MNLRPNDEDQGDTLDIVDQSIRDLIVSILAPALEGRRILLFVRCTVVTGSFRGWRLA